MTLSIYNQNFERIEIELTNTCNLNCELCARNIYYAKSDLKNHKTIDFNKLKDKLKSYKNLKYVTLTGEISEPTLYPQLFELITFLHKNKIEVSLFTNVETHDELYYKKLALLFKNTNSKIFLTIFGSNEKMHQKYRGGSLKRVINIANIISKYSYDNLIMTWVLFEYNYKDYLENKDFLRKFQYNIFNTLPYAERYSIKGDIKLPNNLDKIYLSLDKNDLKGSCKSINNNFCYLTVDLKEYPCSLAKHNDCSFNEIKQGLKPFCYECSNNNLRKLTENNIYTISESENEISEKDLYIDTKTFK